MNRDNIIISISFVFMALLLIAAVIIFNLVGDHQNKMESEEIKKALTEFNSGNYGKCIDISEKFLKNNSGNDEIYRILGISYFFVSENLKSANYFNKAYDKKEEEIANQYGKLASLLIFNRWNDATNFFNKIENVSYKNRKFAEIFYYLQNDNILPLDIRIKILLATISVRLDPENSLYYNNRGISFFDIGILDSALIDLNSAIRIQPMYAVAFLNRGALNYKMKNFDSAIFDLSTAINLNEYRYLKNAYEYRTLCFLNKRDNFKALQDINYLISRIKIDEQERKDLIQLRNKLTQRKQNNNLTNMDIDIETLLKNPKFIVKPIEIKEEKKLSNEEG